MESLYDKVALITGAGAIENAWNPVIRILKPDYKFDFDIDSSNCFMALMVYQLRTIALNGNAEANSELKLMLRDYGLIKQEICRSLVFAENHKEIMVRKQFYSILDKFIFLKHVKFVHITTNWDTVIDNAINYYGHSTEGGSIGRIATFHLHGSVVTPESLYLPSEITREPFRSAEESLQMMKNHSAVLNAVHECNRVILYGLSLDPLDAELSQILALGWNSPNMKEIIVINPDYHRVVKRVKILLNDEVHKINVIAYSPDDLEAKIQC